MLSDARKYSISQVGDEVLPAAHKYALIQVRTGCYEKLINVQ